MLILFLTLSSLVSKAQVDSVGTKKLVMNINGSNLKIPYFSNHSVDSINNGISKAIIVVHGVNRNADDYYANMTTAAGMRPLETDSLAVIAPQFLMEIDIDSLALDSEHLFWVGWTSGSNSKNTASNPRPEVIPSYAVLDTLLIRVANNYPNLKSIVFTGHSAGGQVTNRYAASTSIVDTLCANHQISTKFIVANPSSYLYMDNKRRVSGTVDQFSIPTTTCSDYNDWLYGLSSLYTYPSFLGANAIQDQYINRKVAYLLGENDNNSNSSSLDTSCEAMLQGNHRLERGTIYYNYLIDYYGPTLQNNQSLDTVPGVGHSNLGMYTSTIGLFHLFESYPSQCSDETLSVNSNQEPFDYYFYPNPTNGIITMTPQINDSKVTIFDIQGKVVKEMNVKNSQLDIRELKDGFYFLAIRIQGTISTFRLVKSSQ